MLSALDVPTLGLQAGATKADVEKAMQGHVIGTPKPSACISASPNSNDDLSRAGSPHRGPPSATVIILTETVSMLY
jgi:hypothetical protein